MQDSTNDLETFVNQYIETALWSEMDDDGNPLDVMFSASDIDSNGLAEMRQECEDFVTANAADLANIDASQGGHNFWLNRNRHGVGFWNRGLGDLGDRLSDASKVYGTQGLTVGDDGKLYTHG